MYGDVRQLLLIYYFFLYVNGVNVYEAVNLKKNLFLNAT